MSRHALPGRGALSRSQLAGGVFAALGLLLSTIPSNAGALPDGFSGATGGIVRTPENLQPKNDGNLFGEAWAKLAYELDRGEDTVTSIFTLGNFVADSKGFGYNNTAKIGIGLSHSIQVNDALNVTFSARHDWFAERGSNVRRSGIRLAVDYYYYKRWDARPGEKFLGKPRIATIFKSYGTLAYPGSLEKGDDNLVLTIGGELSADLDLNGTDWILTPFTDFDLSWDKDQNGYNNKIVPGFGLKLRYPLEHGEIFAGARLSADYRPIEGTLEAGPTLFFGWYKGF